MTRTLMRREPRYGSPLTSQLSFLIGVQQSTIVSNMNPTRLPFAILRNERCIQGGHRTCVPWWSITKSVLSAAVMKLAELGAIRLGNRFEDWPFTIQHLLQHTSGLTDYGGQAYQQAVAESEAAWPVNELLRRCNARKLVFSPGEGWTYLNIGYLFLRQLIERVTESNLDVALKQLIFAPLRLASTRIAMGPSDLMLTHWGNPKNYDPQWVYHGLLIGPPADAVAFLARLLAGELLSDASLAAMQEVRTLGCALPGRPWTRTGYGLGLMIGTMNSVGRVVGHSGAGPDSVSALYAFLDRPGRPVVAAFAQGADEAVAEHEARRLALET
jgi:D-alanyl-D-alanine carboxypeptidase